MSSYEGDCVLCVNPLNWNTKSRWRYSSWCQLLKCKIVFFLCNTRPRNISKISSVFYFTIHIRTFKFENVNPEIVSLNSCYLNWTQTFWYKFQDGVKFSMQQLTRNPDFLIFLLVIGRLLRCFLKYLIILTFH